MDENILDDYFESGLSCKGMVMVQVYIQEKYLASKNQFKDYFRKKKVLNFYFVMLLNA